MSFLFSIALGVFTYYGLFDIIHLSDGFATASGWMIGLGTLLALEVLEKQMKHRHDLDRIRLNNEFKQNKNIKKEQNEQFQKEKNSSTFDFFKTKK